MKTFRFTIGVVSALLGLLSTGQAWAWALGGNVYCEGAGLPLAGVTVQIVGVDVQFSATGTTDANGHYYIDLPDAPGSYLASLPNSTVVSPASGAFTMTNDDYSESIDWIVSDPTCSQLGCWLTGGGTKFDTVTGTLVAQHGPQQNFGGNVNPSCSPDPGDGGQWNHVDHGKKLHFQGTAIRVVRCGNVDGIPPGSESPVTPYNFIEYQGTGTLKGIKGNKVDYGTVCFFARAEDRNEPGSNGASDGTLKDRYYINITNCSTGETLLFLDIDGDPATVDPTAITGGNLQIHASSCTQ